MLSTLPKATERVIINKRSACSQRRGSYQKVTSKISQGELPCLDIKGSLKSALVVLHRLWSEGHRSKGVGVAGHLHPNRIHLENVANAAVMLGRTHKVVLGENVLQHAALFFTYAPWGTAPDSIFLPASPDGLLPSQGVTPSIAQGPAIKPRSAKACSEHWAATPAYMKFGDCTGYPANNLELTFKEKEKTRSLRKKSALSPGT